VSSPTQRTLDHYRGLNYDIQVTERWCPHSRKRKDLFNFIDLLAIDDDETLAIQATSTGNMSARVKKILGLPAAWRWLQVPDRKIVVIGWKKYAKPVNRKFWRPTIRHLTTEDWRD
jgi:hypothetical protein